MSDGTTFSNNFISFAGDYWVTVTDVGGCSGTSDTLTIVNGNFTFDLLPSDSLFLCTPNSNVTIDAANGGGGGMWFWNTGANTPTISTSSIGSYHCMIEIPVWYGNSYSYGFSDTVTVSGINPPLYESGGLIPLTVIVSENHNSCYHQRQE